jgi:adenylate kinase
VVFIFTGQSGLERNAYLLDLERVANEKNAKFKVFQVGDMLYEAKPGLKRGKILDLPLAELNALLKAVFSEIRREMVAYDHIAVNMHATFRWKRGLIGGIAFSLIAPLRPDVYVTIIDDVTEVKWRLDQEYPDKQYTYKDVMVWREEEILTTSIFAALNKKLHFVFARKHPIDTLYKLLFEPTLPRIYASFPISAVIDKPEILAEINSFKRELVQDFTVFDPYTISEKKLDYKVRAARKAGQDAIEYDVGGKAIAISIDELLPILPDIDDQIIARDLILVEQSEIIVAFYPCFEDGTPIHSGGREREVSHASANGKAVYLIWPSVKHEPGPFEADAASKIFRSVGEARDYLLKTYRKPPPAS